MLNPRLFFVLAALSLSTLALAEGFTDDENEKSVTHASRMVLDSLSTGYCDVFSSLFDDKAKDDFKIMFIDYMSKVSRVDYSDLDNMDSSKLVNKVCRYLSPAASKKSFYFKPIIIHRDIISARYCESETKHDDEVNETEMAASEGCMDFPYDLVNGKPRAQSVFLLPYFMSKVDKASLVQWFIEEVGDSNAPYFQAPLDNKIEEGGHSMGKKTEL